MNNSTVPNLMPSHPVVDELVRALGPLMIHVEMLAPSDTGNGFMVKMRWDTPRPSLEAAYAEFDRHAARLRNINDQPSAPCPPTPSPVSAHSTNKPKMRRKSKINKDQVREEKTKEKTITKAGR